MKTLFEIQWYPAGLRWQDWSCFPKVVFYIKEEQDTRLGQVLRPNFFRFCISWRRFVATKVRRGQCFRIQFEFPRTHPSPFNGGFFEIISPKLLCLPPARMRQVSISTFPCWERTFRKTNWPSEAARPFSVVTSNWTTRLCEHFLDSNCRIFCRTEPTRFPQ